MWAQVISVATLSTILVLSVSRFHDYGEITNGVQWRVPHWAVSLACHGYGTTSLWLDNHVSLGWLMECRMTRVWFQSLNECCLLCLNVAGICRHQWTYLHYLFWRLRSKSPSLLTLLLCLCLWARHDGQTSGISHVACGPNVVATLQAYHMWCYLWRSGWLRLLMWLATWNPLLAIETCVFLLQCI